MNRRWKIFLLTAGAITFAQAASSTIASMTLLFEFFMFGLPFLFSSVIPTAFMYGLVARFALLVSQTLPNSYRMVTVGTFLAAFGIGTPMVANAPESRELTRLHAMDKPLAARVQKSDIVLLLHGIENLPRDTRRIRDEHVDCGSVCLRLLYNGAAKTVIVAAQPGGQPGDPLTGLVAIGWQIDRRPECKPLVPAYGEPWSDERGAAGVRSAITSAVALINARQANGECLVGMPAKVEDASLMIVDRTTMPLSATPGTYPWWLRLPTLRARQIEVLERTHAELTTVGRLTWTERQPLWPILALGPVEVDASNLHIALGFLRHSAKPSSNLYGPEVYRQIFGDGVKLPEALADPIHLRRLAQSALAARDIDTRTRDGRIAAFLSAVQADTPLGDDDFDLIGAIVRVAERNNLAYLRAAISALGARADRIADSVGYRLGRLTADEGSHEVASVMALAVNRMSDAAVASIGDAIIRASAVPSTRGYLGLALERLPALGDRGVRRAIDVLELAIYPDAGGSPSAASRDRQAAFHAAVGLCLAGAAAAPAAGALVELIAADARLQHGRGTPRNVEWGAQAAGVALARLGHMKRLEPFNLPAEYRAALERTIAFRVNSAAPADCR